MIRQIRSRERGMHWAPFVVALVALLVMVYLWHEASQKADGDRTTITNLRAEVENWQKKVAPRTTRLDDIAGAVGASMADNTPPTDGSEALTGFPSSTTIYGATKAALDKWRDQFKIVFDADRYTATGTGGQIEKLAGNKVAVVYLPLKAEVGNVTVEAFIGMVEGATVRMQNDIKRAFEDAANQRTQIVAERATHEAALKAKDEAAATIRAAAAAAQAQHDARERELAEQVASEKAAKQAAMTELEQVKAQAEAAVAKLQSQLNQKHAELQTVVRKDAPYVAEGTDGTVLNSGSGLVIIDLGKKHMLRPGTTFTVFGKVKGGALVPKATIKVNVCGEDTADCVIIEEDSRNPISMGDEIASPLFSKNRQLHFVIVGELRKMGRSQAEGKLKNLGAMIDAQVSATTDYVVVGTAANGENIEDSEAVRRARDYHVTLITEEMLAAMTSY